VCGGQLAAVAVYVNRGVLLRALVEKQLAAAVLFRVNALLVGNEVMSGFLEDIAERGIVLTGGGTLVRGLEDALRNEVRFAVTIVNDPLTAVVNGAGKLLEQPALFNAVIVGSV